MTSVPKIGLDGEAEFRKAISGINTNLKTLGTQMAAVTSAYAANDKSTKNLSEQNKILTKEIAEQKTKVSTLKTELAASEKEFGKNSDQTKRMQQSVNLATADLNKMKLQLKSNKDQIEDNNTTLEKAKAKFSEFGKSAASAAKAAATGLAAFATASVAAATAAGAMVTKAAAAADDINTLSTQTGLSTAEIQKFQYASEKIDVPLETLTGSMAKMTKNMATASKGTGDANAAFKALGVQVTDGNGQLRDRNQVFNEAIKALGSMSNETQRDAYAMQIFGKSAQDLNPLILGGADALKTMGNEAEAAGLILSQSQLDTLNKVQDAIDMLKASATGAGRLFSVELAGPIASGINTITGYLTKLTTAFSHGGFNSLARALSGVLTDMMTKLNTSLPQIVQFGSTLLMGLLSGIVQMLPQIATSAVKIVSTLSGSLTRQLPILLTSVLSMAGQMLPQLVNSVALIISTVANSLSQQLPTLIPMAVNAVMSVATALVDNIDLIVNAALQLFHGFAQGIVAAIPEIITKLPELVGKIVTTLGAGATQFISTGVKLLTSLVNNMPEIIKQITSQLPQIIQSIVSTLTSNIAVIIEAGVTLFTALITNLPQIIKEIVKAIPDIIKAIVAGFKDSWPQLKQAGKDLIKGLWEGIKNMGTWIGDKVKGFAGDIVSKFKEKLGIHSPSTVFAGIGGYMAQGLGNGFEKSMAGVKAQIQRSIPIPDVSMSSLSGLMAGAVNGISTSVTAGNSSAYPATIVLKTRDGRNLASWLISDLRAVGKASPEVVSDL